MQLRDASKEVQLEENRLQALYMTKQQQKQIINIWYYIRREPVDYEHRFTLFEISEMLDYILNGYCELANYLFNNAGNIETTSKEECSNDRV